MGRPGRAGQPKRLDPPGFDPPGFDPDRELERELNAAEAAMHGGDCDCFDCWPAASPSTETGEP